MSTTLNVGQKIPVGIQVIDSLTGTVLANAKLSGQTYAVDNTAAVTEAPDADPTKEDLTAVAAGAANLTGTVVADLSAYGLSAADTLTVVPAVVNVVVPPPPIAPQAVFVFGTAQ